MKPKKQIDFLVEEFFNTGKLNLNKKDEGITFDQLESINELTFPDAVLKKLDHKRPPEDETSTVDTVQDFLNTSIKDAEEEFTLAISKAIDAEQKKDFPAAKKFYEQALSTLNRLSGYSKNELYKGFYGKKELEDTIKRAKAPLGGIGVYNWTQLKNDIARTGRGEKIDVDDEDILSILDIVGKKGADDTTTDYTTTDDTTTADTTTADVGEDEEDITSMQKQISKWKPVELDVATLKVLETFLPNPDALEELEQKLEELTKDGKRLDIDEKEKLKSLNSQITALKDQQKIVARTIIANPCIINSIIYRNPGNLQYFKPLMDKLVNIFDNKVNTKGSKLYKALKNSDEVPDTKIMPFLNNIAYHKHQHSGGGPQTTLNFDEETTEFCGVEVLEVKLKGKSFAHIIQEPIRKEINPTKNPNIQKWLDHAIDMVESIFNHLVSNKVFVQKHTAMSKYEKLLYIIQKYSSGENESEIIEQLTHVAFDLKEMDEMIRKYDLGSPTTQQKITTLINKIFDHDESNNIKDNLREIRISRNKQYELSFTTCVNPKNDIPYFTNKKGGDSSTILQNPNWAGEGQPYKFLYNNRELKRIMDLIFESEHLNSFNGKEKTNLEEFIQRKRIERNSPMLDHSNITNTIGRKGKIREAAQLLFNNIHPSGIKKYDIAAAQDVTVTRESDNFIIADKSLVEVKLTTEYDYHLSEFFGVYKSSEKRLSSEYRDYPQYGQIYGDIIEELYRLMTTGEGKKKGDEILASIKGNTAGIFFEYYKYANMKNDVTLKWDLEGQRKTEKRLSIRCVVDESKLYTWDVEELKCEDKTFLPIVPPTDVIDEYISEALGF